MLFPILAAILLTALTVFFGTAIAAIRSASMTRLTEIARARGREESAERFAADRQHYARAALLAQQFCLLITLGLLVDSTRGIETPSGAFAVVVLVGSAWILVFGVGVPAGWARFGGEEFLASALSTLAVMVRITGPLLATIAGIEEIVRRLMGAPREAPDQSEELELRILDAMSHGETSGTIASAEKEIIRSALALDETSVAEAMTPRTDIVGAEAGTSAAEVRRMLTTEGHSRLPIYEGSIDHVVGILYAKDMLTVTDTPAFRLHDVMRSVMYVPETKDLASLLREFQQQRVHIAIVLDEYGGTAGLVTLEDIMEELIGDIADEHDAPEAPQIRRIDERTAEVDPRVRIVDLNEAMSIGLPVDEAYDTIAGYVFSRLGRIPAAGESTTEEGVRVEVVEAGDRSIRRLRVHLPAAAVSE